MPVLYDPKFTFFIPKRHSKIYYDLVPKKYFQKTIDICYIE